VRIGQAAATVTFSWIKRETAMPNGCRHLANEGRSRPCAFRQAGLSNRELARELGRAPVDDRPRAFAQQGEARVPAPSVRGTATERRRVPSSAAWKTTHGVWRMVDELPEWGGVRSGFSGAAS